MKQPNIKVYTRGQWLGHELKWAVLAMLRQNAREVERGEAPLPFLNAYRLQSLTGCNYGSLRTLLKKWSTGKNKVIDRKKWGGLYVYTITARGHVNFELLTNGYLSRRHGKWVQVNAKAVLRRLPVYQKYLA
ncbi:hypothetical protein ACFLYF_02665 [Chloroflexota bacterium]